MNKSYIFENTMKVRDYECDSQGHVNNANYQNYFEATRHEFLDQFGFKLYDLHKQGIDSVVSKVEIRYKAPLYGMDEFRCCLNIKKSGLVYIFYQDIIRLSDNKLCAKAKIEVVNIINGKLSKPEIFDKLFKDYLL